MTILPTVVLQPDWSIKKPSLIKCWETLPWEYTTPPQYGWNAAVMIKNEKSGKSAENEKAEIEYEMVLNLLMISSRRI